MTERHGYELKRANEWLAQARKRPIPQKLFGEFWLEGETAVLFGDAGTGKSALAMQLAESIARGKGIGPFETAAAPQKVLYIDLEMNDRQFERRYAADHAGGRARFLHGHYRFSDNLIRVEVDACDVRTRGESTGDVFCRSLRRMVEETEASVVIVDSLTSLKRSYYGTREVFDIMKGLKRLRNETGLSILVLFQTQGQDAAAPLSTGRRQDLKMLDSRADSVFGIGHSRHDAAGRYIKHIKTRGDALIYDAENVPAFGLRKTGGNFLGFEFGCFAMENDLLADIRGRREWKTIERIKRLNEEGMSIRSIAAEIGLPRTTVHRLLKMWRPPVEPVTEEQTEEQAVKTEKAFDFPGCGEYDAANDDPRFDDIYDREDEEAYRLRREAYLLEMARSMARQEHLRTGHTPGLKEMMAKINAEYEEPHRDMSLAPVESADTVYVPPVPGTRRSLNAYGREIFIEEEDQAGKPMVWYDFDAKGNKRRMERNGTTISAERVG